MREEVGCKDAHATETIIDDISENGSFCFVAISSSLTQMVHVLRTEGPVNIAPRTIF